MSIGPTTIVVLSAFDVERKGVSFADILNIAHESGLSLDDEHNATTSP